MQVLLAACTLSFLGSVHLAQAAPAAVVEFAIGNVSAVNSAGVSRSLNKGAEVQAGDTIDTGTGRAQLRFSDGAYISLQPNSQFRIDEYNYSGKSDDSERGFFSLIKGGMRTITGLIGRSHRRNYQVRVPVATIGIRGTEYTLLFDGTALGTVGEGEISVCNGAGCLNVSSGQSYFVAGATSNLNCRLCVRSCLRRRLARLVPRHSGDEPANVAESGLELGAIANTNDRVTQDDDDLIRRSSLPPATNLLVSTGKPPPPPQQPVDLSLLFGDQLPSETGPQGGTPRPITTQPVALALAISQFPVSLALGLAATVKSTSADVEGGKLVSWTDTNAFQ
jgi:hypothetical protein